jgi:hypothetical protein
MQSLRRAPLPTAGIALGVALLAGCTTANALVLEFVTAESNAVGAQL